MPSGKGALIQWFRGIQMPDTIDWLVVGDFNLYRSTEDRNKLGADATKMFLFNEAIAALGLFEVPLRGKRLTWTNKQYPRCLSIWTSFSPHLA